MSERVKVTSKIPESKRDNSVSQTRKTDFSQSLRSPVDHILHLQRTIGNQAVQKLFKSGVIQAKLRIGQPNDIYEQEADRVADTVMRTPEATSVTTGRRERRNVSGKTFSSQIAPIVQRQIEGEEEKKEKLRQAKQVPSQIIKITPKKYKPWKTVWIGKIGLVGEVKKGVTVRVFKEWKEDLDIAPRDYVCGNEPDRPHTPDMEKKVAEVNEKLQKILELMKKVGEKMTQMNAKIPENAPQRVALVAISKMDSCFGMANGKGLIVLSEKDFNESTIAHEGAHAIFAYHRLSGAAMERGPDPLASGFAKLYLNLEGTEKVRVPTAKFDPANPPPLEAKVGTEAYPAGLVMVADVLWSGGGGHPWDSVDEFFASACAGYLQEPKLFKLSIQYYQDKLGIKKEWVEELFRLLEVVGRPEAVKALGKPEIPKGLEHIFFEAPVDYSGWRGPLGWLIDPSTLPSWEEIYCVSESELEKEKLLEFD